MEDSPADPVQHANVMNETRAAVGRRRRCCNLKMLSVCGCHTSESKSKWNYLRGFPSLEHTVLLNRFGVTQFEISVD